MSSAKMLPVRDFEDQIRKDAKEVVGRGAEIARLTEVLRGTPEGLGWVGGKAGIGKSYTPSPRRSPTCSTHRLRGR